MRKISFILFTCLATILLFGCNSNNESGANNVNSNNNNNIEADQVNNDINDSNNTTNNDEAINGGGQMIEKETKGDFWSRHHYWRGFNSS